MNMAYIVFGSQQLMVKKQVKKVISDCFKDNKNYEVLHFDSGKITEDELLNECEQFSLCDDSKVIIVENSNFLTAERDAYKFEYTERLVKYLKNENPSTILIFSVVYSKKLDSRNKIYKVIDEAGKVIICNEISEKEWPTQVSLYFNKKNISITKDAINEICRRCSGDFGVFINESNKLVLYKNDNITLDDVKEIVAMPLFNSIFEIQNNLLLSNKEKAIQIFREVQFSKDVDPVSLISIFTNQLLLLDRILYLNKKRLSYSTIASEIGESPYIVIRNLNAFKNVNSLLIKKALQDLYLLDKAIKHSKVNKFYGFELFLINF